MARAEVGFTGWADSLSCRAILAGGVGARKAGTEGRTMLWRGLVRCAFAAALVAMAPAVRAEDGLWAKKEPSGLHRVATLVAAGEWLTFELGPPPITNGNDSYPSGLELPTRLEDARDMGWAPTNIEGR